MSDNTRSSDPGRVNLSQLVQLEAINAHSESRGTQHILLAFLGEYENSAGQILHAFDVTRENAAAAINQVIASGVTETPRPPEVALTNAPPPLDLLPATEQEFQAFRTGCYEVMNRGDRVAVWAHILLGLLIVEDGIAAQSLLALGLDLDQIRDSTLELLDSPDVPVP
ncbi:ATP-dependent Clp protease ATP-binding subunit ClpC1 [Gimesia panareensis]|uniref:ATP-dependent Clp protease ATP-binding subunit ClpC1 n=1 Tax=Gimesia panareensis TaxID=2527978 RepID=A0A518FJ56_9PLAN|nr:Clp protease N-terminal domain-containing protein [Gimesia panareensis]QDV16374.1 ATP-dependent Clp protease ATP-binding subunit ClpC1 [Gimesia panareensis]